jgi:hypothetical protein
MLYKRKQIYWIDGFIGGQRIKTCTGFNDKGRALKFYFNLMEKEMIQNRLSSKIFKKI